MEREKAAHAPLAASRAGLAPPFLFHVDKLYIGNKVWFQVGALVDCYLAVLVSLSACQGPLVSCRAHHTRQPWRGQTPHQVTI